MNCEHVRLLLGVDDELDDPTRRALDLHVQDCAACRSAWAEELEFRRIMSARRVPPANADKRIALLAVPPPGYGRWRVVRGLERSVPLAVAAAAIGLGALVWSQIPPAPVRAPVPVSQDVPVVAAEPIERALAPRPLADSRLAAALESAGDFGAFGPAEPGPAPVDTAQPRAPTGALSPDPESDVVGSTADGTSPVELPADRPGSSQAAPPQPPQLPRAPEVPQEPTANPTVTPTATPEPVADVPLRIVAVADLVGGTGPCPGCDGVTAEDAAAARDFPLGTVTVAWAQMDGAGNPGVFTELTLAAVDAGTAYADVAVPQGAPILVRLIDAGAGYVLCSSSLPEWRLSPGASSATSLLATFVLGPECPLSAAGFFAPSPPPGVVSAPLAEIVPEPPAVGRVP